MSSPDLTDLPATGRTTFLHGYDARPANATPFWAAGIGVGVNVILSQLDDIDRLSQRISVLPDRASPQRAVLSDYIDSVRGLASCWLHTSRPRLLAVLRDLHGLGEQLDGADAPLHRPAALVRHLDGIGAGLDGLNTDLGGYLEQMALASAELETDTVLVTHRLQADQLHAAMLSQQLQTLQDRVGQARSRQHGCFPLSSRGEQLRREIAAQGDILDSTRRQLEQIRACQADTLAEAAYLQNLLPTLSSYLAAIDRMGAGIDAALLGLRAMQGRLRVLDAAADSKPADADSTRQQQLHTALPHWRHLSARLASGPG